MSKERVDAQAAKFGLKCIETSALSGFNVEEVFKEMGKLALNRVEAEKRELEQERTKRDNGVDINAYGKNNGGLAAGVASEVLPSIAVRALILVRYV